MREKISHEKTKGWEDTVETAFDRQTLYELLCKVPYGRVVTYGRLAEMMGNRHFARAVGNALHANPDGDLYPCYKAVNRNGALSCRYAFGGIEAQKRRLEAEGIEVTDFHVDIQKYGV